MKYIGIYCFGHNLLVYLMRSLSVSLIRQSCWLALRVHRLIFRRLAGGVFIIYDFVRADFDYYLFLGPFLRTAIHYYKLYWKIYFVQRKYADFATLQLRLRFDPVIWACCSRRAWNCSGASGKLPIFRSFWEKQSYHIFFWYNSIGLWTARQNSSQRTYHCNLTN